MSDSVLTPEERERISLRVAVHEAGHCLYLWNCQRYAVTGVGFHIYEDDDNGGYEVMGATVTGALWSASGIDEVFDDLCVDVSGLAAEITLLGKHGDEGLDNDLKKCLSRAEMIVRMPGWPKPVQQAHHDYPGPLAFDVTTCLDQAPPMAVGHLMNAAYRRVNGMQRDQIGLLGQLAAAILLKRRLLESAIEQLMGPQALHPSAVRP